MADAVAVCMPAPKSAKLVQERASLTVALVKSVDEEKVLEASYTYSREEQEGELDLLLAQNKIKYGDDSYSP
ncbi:hypothetical protein NDU88_001262 [Pleurodeles waltl]|uniref:Uncharacterized protein n=1 Tax=Pleurodeles waltl TaxID=8319 RepID=A0AAV7KVT3_PLEWA|nr:hypothetical protein NDU88_001262 [Pleurodeles waltl]